MSINPSLSPFAVLEYPHDKSIPELFDRVVSERWNDIAVTCDEERLSYGELFERSNQLSNYLIQTGIKLGDRVGICMEHSVWLLVSILAVLKAGANYVAIDPEYPENRIQWILKDSGVSTMILHADTAYRFHHDSGLEIVIGGEWAGFLTESKTVPNIRIHSLHVACVIYTSGSTGNPKGVLISHRNIVNLAYAAIKEFGITYKDKFLQVAAITFSASLEELYPALLGGASIVYAGRRKTLISAKALLKVLSQERITLFELVTAHWHEVVNEVFESGLKFPESLRLLVMGGERPLKKQFEQWRQTGIQLIHVYGPTENTATATYLNCREYRQDLNDREWQLPIGKAIANAQIYILDSKLNPVPVGVKGELFVGGDCVAYGYLNQASKTAEQFIPDPFSSRIGGRLYRTGDIAEFLPDGNAVFYGRSDYQVKVHGYRIELHEIESMLEKHSFVKQAIVLVKENPNGVKQLAAYVVGDSESPVKSSDLKDFVSRNLPRYMVPDLIIRVDSLPVTSHGKINRQALRNLPDVFGQDREFAAPQNETEQKVLNIWQDQFNNKDIGVLDNFLDLGGNSILAARIAARINTSLGLDVLPTIVLTCQTIRTLSNEIINNTQKHISAHASIDLDSIKQRRKLISKMLSEKTASPMVCPISLSQQGLWFLNQMNMPKPVYNEAWSIQLTGSLNIQALQLAFQSMMQRHELLRTRIVLFENQPVFKITNEISPLTVNVSDSYCEKDVKHLMAKEAAKPFDLNQDQLVRANLYRIDVNKYILMFNFHHIIFDGLSMGVVLRELTMLYERYSCGKAPPLPELELQYFDFALWQRFKLQGAALAQLQDYWKRQFAGVNGAFAIPADFPRPKVQTYVGDNMVYVIPEKVKKELLRFSNKEGFTLFTVLLTAFKIVLHKKFEIDDIIVGTPVAGRHKRQFDHLIGLFVNTLPLRTDLSGDPTIIDLMRKIRDVCFESYNHQDLVFDQIVDMVQPVRSSSHHPIFQILFEMEEDVTTNIVQASDLQFGSIEDIPTGTTKFDLAFLIKPTGSNLQLTVSYCTALYKAQTVERMVQQYMDTLEFILQNSRRRISESR